MLLAILRAISCLLDLEHCARWQATPWGPRCAEVELQPRCEVASGWHLTAQGIPVCTRACGEDGPTT